MTITLAVSEQAAIETVRDILLASEDDLISGISFQGAQKRIQPLATSVLTPPTGYIAMAVDCNNVRTASADQSVVRNPPRINYYQVTIVIVDAAYIEYGEEAPFAQAHENFRLVADRVMSLIESSYRGWVEHTASGLKFQLWRNRGNDRAVDKTNIIPRLAPNDDTIIELRCAVSFTLESRCQPS